MHIPEPGVHQNSERYFFTPSSMARELFYYPTRCGHYFCDHEYYFNQSSEIAQQGDHNQNIMLFVVTDGAMEFRFSEGPALAGRGQIILFDCRQPYEYHGADGLEYYWMLFNGLNARSFYQRIFKDQGSRHVFQIPAFMEVRNQLNSLVESCAREEVFSEAARSQMIHRVLCQILLNESAAQDRGGDRIAQAIRYMNKHIYERLTVEQIAQAVGLSPSHFSRQFKRQTGYSPYEYIVLHRIDGAKNMLLSTQMSVKEIAYSTGYNSEENFIHSFQKNVGISPGMFRKYPI